MRIKVILLALTALMSLSAYGQFGVGIRDNRFVYGDFTFCKNYEVKLEQSVFSEKIGFQYLRAYIGYKNSYKALSYKADAYFGSTYNRSYYSAGANLSARYTLFNRVIVDARLNPHYDSGAGYNTCFYAGAGVIITRHIDLLAGYSTIPEYRLSEKRIRAGFDFHVSNLSVSPMLSIDVDGASKGKTLRALVSFRYQFGSANN